MTRGLLGLFVIGIAAWALLAIFGAPEAEAEISPFQSSAECKECHPAVYAEWQESQHSHSWTNPLVRAPDQSNNFSNSDCIDCHAPKPIFDTGIGERVLPRTIRRVEGVDCIACHALPDGQMAGTLENRSARCRPVIKRELRNPQYCAGCHNQHGTMDQWEASEYPDLGQNCLSCHMPEIQRADGRTGRRHDCLGAAPVMLKQAVELDVRVEDGVWTASVTNVGAGHNYPTDERSRASDLFWRPEGESEWRHAYRFRNPYRFEVDLPNTELAAHATQVVPLPEADSTGAIEVGLFYKRTPRWLDAENPDPEGEAIEVHRGVFQP